MYTTMYKAVLQDGNAHFILKMWISEKGLLCYCMVMGVISTEVH